MPLKVKNIENILLLKKSHIKQPYFFSHNTEFLNTKISNFRRLMIILVIELKILNPELLQNTPNGINNNTETKKIQRLENAIKMGLQELKSDEKFYFQGKEQVSELLSCYFYVTKRSFNSFIINILIPLLNMVQCNLEYKWVKMEGKGGFWRELKENETMTVGSEVSLNLSTGLKMIKLS
jgi:hypothetical protein